MRESVKHLSVALVALGLGMPAFADSIVMVPSQHGGFKVGIDALYLRASNSDLIYATSLAPTRDILVDSEKNQIVDMDYQWGFYVQAGYLFSCTGNDLTLGYTRLHTDESNSIDMPPDEDGNLSTTILPLSTFFGPLNNALAAFQDVTGKATFDLDTVDLEAGQRFTTGAFDMRMFAGVRYTKIDHTLQTLASSDINIQGEIVYMAFGNQSFDSDFEGVGPRVGVDSRYCFGSGFGLDAQLSTSLLIGNVDAGYNTRAEVNFPGAFRVGGSVESANVTRSRVVPNIDVKLGVDYTYPISCGCNKSAMVVEAGYQTSSYFNAIDHTTVVVPAGDAFAYQGTTTDVTFDGIYFGVKYYA